MGAGCSTKLSLVHSEMGITAEEALPVGLGAMISKEADGDALVLARDAGELLISADI